MARIIVCDDEKDIVDAIGIYLRAEGHEVLKADNGEDAINMLDETVDLLIIDIMMPGIDGINATLKIREKYSLPIIILSAKGEYEDRVLGLNVGADDYVVKPFNGMELVARVNSCLRRYNITNQQEQGDMLRVKNLELNDRTKEVSVSGTSVSLTPSEYKILKLLMQSPNRVYTSNQIYEQVWGEEPLDVKKIISVHMSHLRDKIEIDPRNPELIKSIYGMGYKLEGD
ncbi:MAG: response regulator transcription factor [Tissierellia bacterium]|nr:response regulator transcription factor [Tissierellia bacterium]